MRYIFITLKMPGKTQLDLKIPAFVTGEELLKMLTTITKGGLAPGSKIQAEPLGRILDNSQTLDAEGVGQGALLTIL
ncbi:MAG: EsaB/YukD family protein [Clostridiales bacterium]|nr:EsaB/YukD family protein [Clostridiales bacterium]